MTATDHSRRRWFIALNDETKGPFTAAEIAFLARCGRLTSDTYIRESGWDDWRVWREVKSEELWEKDQANVPPDPAPGGAFLGSGWSAFGLLPLLIAIGVLLPLFGVPFVATALVLGCNLPPQGGRKLFLAIGLIGCMINLAATIAVLFEFGG